jgi:RNA polymerase sigma-70 factor, ECF subfamily
MNAGVDNFASDSDGNLLERLRGGEPKALSDLYDLYGKLAYIIILRIVKNPAVAEDLVQETFLRAWNHGGSLSPDYGCIRPWLLRIAKYCALDYVKSFQSRVVSLSPEDGWIATFSIEADLLTAERARALTGALRRLTPNQRLVIDMAYYQGLSQSEIAAALKQPLGTIKAWTRAALLRLQEHVDRSLISNI